MISLENKRGPGDQGPGVGTQGTLQLRRARGLRLVLGPLGPYAWSSMPGPWSPGSLRLVLVLIAHWVELQTHDELVGDHCTVFEAPDDCWTKFEPPGRVLIAHWVGLKTHDELVEDHCMKFEAPDELLSDSCTELEAPGELLSDCCSELEAPGELLSDCCTELEAPGELVSKH